MKAFTDIEQSKKLAEILPIESADMWWAERYEGHTTMDFQYVIEETPYYYLSLKKPSIDNYSQDVINDIPCWSLAALLSVLPYPVIEHNYNDKWVCRTTHKNTIYLWEDYSLIDACYKMIEKLHTENLI